MSRYVSPAWRNLIANRAHHLCEYCLSFEGFSVVKFQVEHIISIKHRGLTTLDNLAYSCVFCNRNKGSDIGTILRDQQFVRFFNPRTDQWKDHFAISGVLFSSKTEIGEATLIMLDLNHFERLMERQALQEVGFFPHPNAFQIIS